MTTTRQNWYQPSSTQETCVNGHVRPDASSNLNLKPIMVDSDAGNGAEFGTQWREGA